MIDILRPFLIMWLLRSFNDILVAQGCSLVSIPSQHHLNSPLCYSCPIIHLSFSLDQNYLSRVIEHGYCPISVYYVGWTSCSVYVKWVTKWKKRVSHTPAYCESHLCLLPHDWFLGVCLIHKTSYSLMPLSSRLHSSWSITLFFL